MATRKEWLDRAEAAGLSVERTGEQSGIVNIKSRLIYVEAGWDERDCNDLLAAINRSKQATDEAARHKDLGYVSPTNEMQTISREFNARFMALYAEMKQAMCLFGEGDIICNGKHFGPVVKVEVKYLQNYVDIRYQFKGEDGELYWANAYTAAAYGN